MFKKILRGASIYGAWVLAAKAYSFGLLPIFWHYLTPAEFGIVGIVAASQIFLVPILSLSLQDSLMRFYFEWPDVLRAKNSASLIIFTTCWGIFLCTVLSTLCSTIPSPFNNENALTFANFIIWSSFFSSMVLMPLAVLRISGRVKLFSAFSALTSASQATAGLIALTIFDLDVTGFIAAGLISNAFWTIALSISMFTRGINFRFLNELKLLLKYSLPFLPSALMEASTGLLDRFFLEKFSGLKVVGFYHIASQIGSGFSLVNQSLKSAWFPFLYELVEKKREESPLYLSYFSLLYTACLIPIVLWIALVSKEILYFVGNGFHEEIYAFVPWILLGLFFQSTATAVGRGLDLAKKNGFWILISVFHAFSMFLSLYLFMPVYGALGAAYAFATAAFVKATVQITLAHIIFPRPFVLCHIGLLGTLATLTFVVVSEVNFNNALEALAMKTTVTGFVAMIAYRFSINPKGIPGLPIEKRSN